MNSRLPLLAVLLVAFSIGLLGGGFDGDLFGWLFVASGVYSLVLAVLLGGGVRLSERLFPCSPLGQVMLGVAATLLGALMLGVDVVPEGQVWLVRLAALVGCYAGLRMEARERERRQSGL